MKRHGNLWDGMISFESLLRAAKRARHGKRFRPSPARRPSSRFARQRPPEIIPAMRPIPFAHVLAGGCYDESASGQEAAPRLGQIAGPLARQQAGSPPARRSS